MVKLGYNREYYPLLYRVNTGVAKTSKFTQISPTVTRPGRKRWWAAMRFTKPLPIVISHGPVLFFIHPRRLGQITILLDESVSSLEKQLKGEN